MTTSFDIFLSHNSEDKPAIREVKQQLLAYDLKVWLDEDELPPGHNWIPLLEEAICQCKSAGAFVGSNGIGQWEDEEIQALLREAVRKKTPVIPVLLPGDYEKPKLPVFLSNRTYLDMRGGITQDLIMKLVWGITGNKPEAPPPHAQQICIDRLPTVAGDFFGREAELQMLDDALADSNTRILQFIASGGTGKTKLLRHWLNLHLDDIPNYLIWSFYSQGTSDSKQVSASPLITEAFKAFGVDPAQYATDEDRVDKLAEWLIEHQCLLVLDGLEPMQHGGQGFVHGQLKDRAMKRLLQTLAQGRSRGQGTDHSSLCMITSRLPVHELKDRPHVIHHPLDNLSRDDGVRLLRTWGVQGRDCELQDAVQEVEGHALTLHLLGNALTTYLDSDIRKRDTLDELIDDYGEQGRHAFRVMQGYQRWLTDDKGLPGAELQCLYLLGLFDHPVEEAVLQVLWDKAIPDLTAGIPAKAWKVAISNLRDQHRLLSAHGERPDLLDCHPLIREYFGKQLQTRQPQAWQAAHETLYHYYKTIPDDEQPDSVDAMQPLFHAIAHGCAAGLHQQVFHEVYWPRINRENENYIEGKLGAFSDNLAVVAHFFSQPWRVPAAGLGEAEKRVC